MNIGNFNIISEHAKIGKNVTIGNYCMIEDGVEVGDNTIIKNYVELRKNTIIGKDCYIDSRVSTSGDCIIDNNSTIRYGVIIARNVCIEEGVFIAPQVMFEYSDFNGVEHPGTVIGSGCKIGTNATIGLGIQIEPDTIIGEKALVRETIRMAGLYVGVPAKPKRIFKKEELHYQRRDYRFCEECGRRLTVANSPCPISVHCKFCRRKRQSEPPNCLRQIEIHKEIEVSDDYLDYVNNALGRKQE